MARATDNKGIRKTVGLYADGLKRGSVKTLKEAFRPQAIVSGYMGTEKFVKPVAYLYQFVRKTPSPVKRGDKFTCTVRSIAVAGKTATVQVLEKAYIGEDYSTSLQLMKMGAKWWIVSKLFMTPPG